jgi:hypothetical protein
MTVLNETADYYRYIDLTSVVEFLFDLIEQTLDTDLIQELNFLRCYDEAARELTHAMDGLSGKEIDLFIKFCCQNGMRVSADKRQKFFPKLNDEEAEQMQNAVRQAFEVS